jgi:hypothetical protein
VAWELHEAATFKTGSGRRRRRVMANAELKVFHGVGAVVSRVKSPTQFSVWSIVSSSMEEFAFAEERLFEVDLHATPTGIGVTDWSKVKFDDRGMNKFGGEVTANVPSFELTNIFRDDLRHGPLAGALYIEHDFYDSIFACAIASPLAPWPPANRKLYEYTSIAYSASPDNGARAKSRYYGFRGRVVKLANDDDGNPMAFIEILFPNGAVRTSAWFELEKPQHCDREPPSTALGGESSITTTPQKGAEGAIFIALPYALSLGLAGGKLPIGGGG